MRLMGLLGYFSWATAGPGKTSPETNIPRITPTIAMMKKMAIDFFMNSHLLAMTKVILQFKSDTMPVLELCSKDQ
jgi:hypothetical protein